ncbi:hypothetical protein [Arthrobacter sp. NPDC080082]|uniref:hypothetical protein n=1 Tax=unclassified Arthrobacter TaxID=235627 RepID=UPI003429DE8F
MNDKIEWNCDVCGRAIEDGQGYLTVNQAQVKEAQRDLAEWKNQHKTNVFSVTDLMDRPDFVKWQAVHASCDPRSDYGDYSIGIDRIGTARHALGWTLHLHGKEWTGTTDWDEFIKARAEATMDR